MAKTTRSRPAAGSEACARSDASLIRAFELLGRRWTGVILGTLSDGTASFRELARAVPGIGDSMLATRLASLADAGLVTRTVDEGPPVSVTYQLTDAGRALLPALEQISRWADEHLQAHPSPREDASARKAATRGSGSRHLSRRRGTASADGR